MIRLRACAGRDDGFETEAGRGHRRYAEGPNWLMHGNLIGDKANAYGSKRGEILDSHT